jgi:hypothetical protein
MNAYPAVAFVFAACVFGPACDRASTVTTSLTTDEACELLVGKDLHELFDGWGQRLQIVVWCNRSEQEDIAVTIRPANRQIGVLDVALVQSQAENSIAGLLKRKHWEARYRRTVVQVLP